MFLQWMNSLKQRTRCVNHMMSHDISHDYIHYISDVTRLRTVPYMAGEGGVVPAGLMKVLALLFLGT